MLLALILAGCAIDDTTFADEFPVAACDYAADCGATLGSEDMCETTMGELVDGMLADETCAYDAGQARQCIRELTADTCDERTAVYYECKRVFVGDDCELDMTDALF